MDDAPLIQHLALALERLWDDGCPVAGSDAGSWQGTARVALRRWRSFDRRSKRKLPTREEHIEDLAKGLRDAFERDPRLVGPLMEDYRHVARTLAGVLDNA
jgi:hypothetical protein